MSENPEEPRDPQPLRPVHPPDPAPPVVPSPKSTAPGSGATEVGLGFVAAFLLGVMLLSAPRVGLTSALVGIPTVGIILSIFAPTRKFGLGMLLAFGIAILILLAICGNALKGGFH